jgi:mitochondrial fission protein ELM1
MDSGLLDSPTPSLRPAAEGAARVWLLLGKYGGDNAQVRALGDHLAHRFGWAIETRRIHFYHAHNAEREKFPDAIDFKRSESLAGPFPDVVISCSRYYGRVGTWLKQSADRPMVHVHLGRIGSPMSAFDLIAATPQYGLPATANFIPLTLPFVLQDPVRTEAAVAAWRASLETLPRPWTVLMTGGPIPRVRFGGAEADRIADQAIQSAHQAGGSLILVVSRRTPGPLRERIAARIAEARELPSWSVDWPAPDPNPYPALLALGDRFVVTSDSASMIADACVTGKPVELVRLPVAEFVRRLSSRGLGLSIDARRRCRRRADKRPDVLDRLRDALVARHWMRPWDELEDFLHAIDAHGLLAADAGMRAQRIQAEELDHLAARIAALVAAAKRKAPPAPEPRPLAAEAA